MDKLTRYKYILEGIVNRFAENQPSHGQIATFPIYDPKRNHYLLVDVGWDNTGRVHELAFHARLENGKVWIEWDGTEPSLSDELIAAGIPPADIVPAFYRPEYRALLDRAANSKAKKQPNPVSAPIA